MSTSRYPDNNRYPRERSPYRDGRDRRPSTYMGGGYPRGGDSYGRGNVDSVTFPPRDVPRGPKSLADAPRSAASGPPSGIPSGPRDGRGRGFAGRGDGAPLRELRDAPPLSSATHNPRDHRGGEHWRADRDRDRDFRDRRPSPSRRSSPIRDSRDFSLNIDRARRNSRDGPLSAGSTYSDPPLPSGSSYRGSGIGRGRGAGRDFGGDFRPRGRGYINDERDRHHDPRDARDRNVYRPRSRSREPLRRERDAREERDFERRDRDDRRFERRDEEPRRYDSYQGTGTAGFKPGLRTLDTHRSSAAIESRNLPGTPTGPSTPHSAHHPGTADRPGPPVDAYSRRSSVATGPSSAKEARRESDANELLASRAEFSKERYAPRASSPPASVPAFGYSNVWRNPALDSKAPAAPQQKPVAPTPVVPAPTPASGPPAPLPARKPSIPSGLSTIPPTGPKADRLSDRPQSDPHGRPQANEPPRSEPTSRPPPASSVISTKPQGQEGTDVKVTGPGPLQAISPPVAPGVRHRPPPSGPQAGLRATPSPSFPRAPLAPYASRDVSPGAIPSGPRNALSVNASPKTTPINIPTGPKVFRTNPMAQRPPMYPPPKNQWVSPRLLSRPPTVPAKREFPMEDRDRAFGTAPKAPRLENNRPVTDSPRFEQPKVEVVPFRTTSASAANSFPISTEQQRKSSSPKLNPVKSRRSSDVSMPDVSPTTEKPPLLTAPPVPEVMDDSDDDLDLDEDDFAESEAKYQREKARLEARLVDLSVAKLRATTPLQEIILLSNLSLEHLPREETQLAEEEEVEERPKEPLQQRAEEVVEEAMEDAAHEFVKVQAEQPKEGLVEVPAEAPAENSGKEPAKEPVKSTVEVPVEEPVDQTSRIHTHPPPESVTTELLTPKADDSEDAVMAEKHEPSIAPATRALRLRQEHSAERESTPEALSSLPYLVSGPPTPLSDPDHDRPTVPESVLQAIRNNIRKEAAPETPVGDVLKEYAATYKRWRTYVQNLDQEREHEDPDVPPSTERPLKGTTPDVASSSTGAALDGLPATGRRTHDRRFATEFDLEQALKESLKTAEEERMGKRDSDTQKMLWDPEREATVPAMLSAYEAERRRFIDTNFQREPGQGLFVYHYEPPEDDFTEEEHRVMVQHYREQFAKKWGKLAEILHKELGTSRTYKDTINHYYATKWGRDFKQKARRGRVAARKKAGGAGRGRGAPHAERSDIHGDDAPLPLTDSGRPRRQAAPTFGAEPELDTLGAAPTPGRQRRQTDADGNQEKISRPRKVAREGRTRKPKNQPLAAAPVPSPVKVDRKERLLGVKAEDDPGKHQVELPAPDPPVLFEEQLAHQIDLPMHAALPTGPTERPRSNTNSRPGPSSYWSVVEQNDFQRNVAHFGTDWAAIANHMGTKTQTMVKNQYQRLIEGSSPGLARLADEADKRRERGEDLGPPPTPTPAPKRRYDNTQVPLPRTLAPTPEMSDLLQSPASQTTIPSRSSPPHPSHGRFSTIAQAPLQATAGLLPHASSSIPETTLAALPSLPSRPSPPPPSRVQPQHVPHLLSQHKPHHGPRLGYFSDDQPVRMDSRGTLHQSSVVHPPRAVQQLMQPHVRGQDPIQVQFRAPVQESEPQPRVEQRQEHDMQIRYQEHTRRVSQEMAFSRQFPANVAVSTQPMGSLRATPTVSLGEERTLHTQQSRYGPPHTQPSLHPSLEMASQLPGHAVPSQLGSRSVPRTPPVKEEQRQYPMPPHPPHSQPTPQPQLQAYPQPTPSLPQQRPAAPPATKPALPKKSNLNALLNDEPEEPRRKKTSDATSHTPTPQQSAPAAPVPPSSSGPPSHRDLYGDSSAVQSPYVRSLYGQPPPQPHLSSARPVVDLTSEQPSTRIHQQDAWQQRQTYHPGQTPAQNVSINSPRPSLAQPGYGDSRNLSGHRSLLAQQNGPRHNPSPPPSNAYKHSPHMHSRASSISDPSSQQPRHGITGPTATQATQAATASSQILQPNPYAQVDPAGGNSQPAAPVGMRPSPHHTSIAQQREMQGRNDQSRMHNANLSYSNPQTPTDGHTGRHHLRGVSVAEQHRPADGRDFHDFDSRTHDRDSARELSQRSDVLLRQQREALMARSGVPQHAPQDLRYQPTAQPDRGYPSQRSRTPISGPEHTQHPGLQRQMPPSLLGEGSRPSYGQRPQEDASHRFRDPYAGREDGVEDRMREEHAFQARRMNDEYMQNRNREFQEREIRERDARFRDEMMRRERQPGPPPQPVQQGQQQQQQQYEQRPGGHAGQMDWTSAVQRQQERWQQHQR